MYRAVRTWKPVWLLFPLLLSWVQAQESKGAAEAAMQVENYSEAARLYTLAATESEAEEQWSAASRSWSAAAKVYRDHLGQMDAAIEAFERVIDLQNAHVEPPKRSRNVAHFYNLIGDIFQKKSDYDRALQVYRQALKLREETYGRKSPQVAQVLTNMGTAYRFKGNFAEAHDVYAQALALRKAAPENRRKLGIVYNQIGELFLEEGNNKAAYAALKQALTLFEQEKPLRNDYLAEVKASLAKTVEQLGDSTTAAKIYLEALAHARQGYGPLDREVAQILVQRGQGKCARMQLEEGIADFQEGLKILVPGFEPQGLAGNPTEAHISADPWVFVALEEKAGALFTLYQQRQKFAHLEMAFEAYETASRFADLRRAAYWSEAAGIALTDEVYPASERALQVAHLLYAHDGNAQWLRRAFRICERSKAAQIRAIRQREADLPQAMLQDIQRLEQAIRTAEKALHFAEGVNLRDSLQETIFGLRKQHGRQLTLLKRQYLGFAIPSLDVDSVQQQLPDSATALVEYFVGEEAIFAFVVRRGAVSLTVLPGRAQLERDVSAFRAAVSAPPQRNSAIALRNLVEPGQRLYSHLLAPLLPHLNGVSRLVIVPDDILWQLPFEALPVTPFVAEEHDFAALDWLLKQYEISYAYAGTLRQSPHTSEWAGDRKILAVAPTYRAVRGFAPLAGSAREVTEIARHFLVDSLRGPALRVAELQALLPHYAALHFSAHAVANDTAPAYSFIALGDTERLYLQDVYGLDLRAEMVVLSACETGAGALVRGEGQTSLARGFAERGCPAMVMSLWKADDQATAALMQQFYAELAQGRRKSAALQGAKLRYLQSNAGPFAHPFYWAQFVLLGEVEPLALDAAEAANAAWWWGLLVLFLAGGAWYRWRVSRQ